jgi:F0F1-type ATP synthase membrane subunit b/b'
LNTEKPTASDEAKFAESHLKQEDRIRTAISEEKCRIAEMVDRDIAVAVDRAGHELNAYAAELAVTLAGARIQVDISTDKALVHNFIDHWDKMATIARLPSKADRLSLFILDRH